MTKKMIWMLSALVLCVLVGCSEVQGTGSKEDPYRLTIAQLKANPEQYDMQWVEFDAYLYCERTDWACTEEIHYQLRTATLLQENAEEDTKNRDKIAMVLTEYDEDYEEMKELVEEALREGKTIKVRAKGLFELNPFHLEGEVAARSQFLGHQMLERIE